MSNDYIPDWCYKQNDKKDACTAPIINGVPLCSHVQPEREGEQ